MTSCRDSRDAWLVTYPSFTVRRILWVPVVYGLVFGCFRGLGVRPGESDIWQFLGATGLAGIVLIARNSKQLVTTLASILLTLLGVFPFFPLFIHDANWNSPTMTSHLCVEGGQVGLLGLGVLWWLRPITQRRQPRLATIIFVAACWASLISSAMTDSGQIIIILIFLLTVAAFFALWLLTLLCPKGFRSWPLPISPSQARTARTKPHSDFFRTNPLTHNSSRLILY